MTLVEVGQGDSNQHVEEGEDGEEVAKADVQIARDTHIGVEEDEKDGQVLGDPILKGTDEEALDALSFFFSVEFSDAVEAVAGGEDKEEEKGQGFLEEKDNWEVPGRGINGDGTEKIVDVTSRGA